MSNNIKINVTFVSFETNFKSESKDKRLPPCLYLAKQSRVKLSEISVEGRVTYLCLWGVLIQWRIQDFPEGTPTERGSQPVIRIYFPENEENWVGGCLPRFVCVDSPLLSYSHTERQRQRQNPSGTGKTHRAPAAVA